MSIYYLTNLSPNPFRKGLSEGAKDDTIRLLALRGCRKSQNPLTAKGTKREEIAQRAILAQGPDCVGGLLRKDLKGHNINDLSLRPLRNP
jgi:hypothetical protein